MFFLVLFLWNFWHGDMIVYKKQLVFFLNFTRRFQRTTTDIRLSKIYDNSRSKHCFLAFSCVSETAAPRPSAKFRISHRFIHLKKPKKFHRRTNLQILFDLVSLKPMVYPKEGMPSPSRSCIEEEDVTVACLVQRWTRNEDSVYLTSQNPN
jgi:hypothetical protein